ncbi:MAG TPA: MerR family transcriptional regulator [Candidatus Sulfopaludibacter sp.]|nr:MerR family transcriptional regulator [Candidatus Sulfopaludibacter sp.]
MQDLGFTIRTMADRSGMTAHTLRYYERVGLIQPVGRARNGHRRYSEADAAWLNFLHCMRATNMPIREMQRYAALRAMGDATIEQRRQLLEEHQATIASQIAALERAHALLSHKIANYRKVEERTRLANPTERETGCEPLAAAS